MEVIPRWGVSYQIGSDQGTHFTGKTMKQALALLGVRQRFHIPCHPQSSGMGEGMNRTLKQSISKIILQTGKGWNTVLPANLWGLRATPAKSTGFTPFELMTGRAMVLPQDAPPLGTGDTSQFQNTLLTYLRLLSETNQANHFRVQHLQEAHYLSRCQRLPPQAHCCSMNGSDWIGTGRVEGLTDAPEFSFTPESPVRIGHEELVDIHQDNTTFLQVSEDIRNDVWNYINTFGYPIPPLPEHLRQLREKVEHSQQVNYTMEQGSKELRKDIMWSLGLDPESVAPGNRAGTERPESGLRPDSQSPASGPPRLPVPGLRPLPDSQSPASGPSPTPSPRPQAPPRLPVPGLRPLPDSQSPASGPSPTPSPRPQPPPRLPVPGLRPLPDSQSPASAPSPTPSPRPQPPPRLPVPGLSPLPDSQSPASGPSPTPSPRPQAPPRLPVPGLRPLPDSQSPASGPSPTPSPRPQAPPRLPVPGLRPSPPPPALFLPLAALNQLLAAGAISFQLPSNARKCLREEIHKDRLVTDSSGHILYSKEEATKGKIAFTTDDYDMFEICFESRLPPDRQGGEAEAT
ncbi:uncharacterized protein [Heptranchias perlo]|uniref:uncharacterized protein n=1 Tax=Heptranchias perlo TaxID=212740 RepID=UPI0035597983